MSDGLRKDSITKVTFGLAVVLAVVVAVYALRLLIVGIPLTIVPEVPEGSQELPRVVSVEYAPYPVAVIPLLTMILLVGGLLSQKLLLAWLGWAILGIFSALFLFSSGAALVPAVGVLFVLLTIISYARRQPDGGLGVSKERIWW